jgi:hypothetical protein
MAHQLLQCLQKLPDCAYDIGLVSGVTFLRVVCMLIE